MGKADFNISLGQGRLREQGEQAIAGGAWGEKKMLT